MAQFDYTADVPGANNKPSVDQPKMKINTQSINDIIAQDHVTFNSQNGGYHTVIHGLAQNRTRSGVGAITANFPSSMSTIQQIFGATYTPDTTGGVSDTQLFSLTGNGGLSQITGNRATADGWCWMGGMLVQWGTITFGGSSSDHKTGTVTFKDRSTGCIPFPNNVFIVVPGLQVASSGDTTASNTIAIRDFSTTQFRYVFNSSSSTGSARYPGFYWAAVGN